MPFRGDAGCSTFGVMGIEKGRIDQPSADDAAFCVLMFIRDITLLKINEMCLIPSKETSRETSRACNVANMGQLQLTLQVCKPDSIMS